MTELPLKTPLFDLHNQMKARMVKFANYLLPVNYPLGVKNEHLHCRSYAGVFDVSHMGQIRVEGKQAAIALERLLPLDLIGLAVGKQKYTVFTNKDGGIIDDLMIANMGDHFHLVVNGACKHKVVAHLIANLPKEITVTPLFERALIAFQGPLSASVLSQYIPECTNMMFLDVREINITGTSCVVSRSGYTGEDGFEISLPPEKALGLTKSLLAHSDVTMLGLGARDSLRLEAGLCLYGQDLTETTTPVESGLLWSISQCRRPTGERAGGFLGEEKIMQQIQLKSAKQKRIGLVGENRVPVRQGSKLFDEHDQLIGSVTSGTFSPSRNQPIAMGYVQTHHATENTRVFAEVRGKKQAMKIEKMPFVPQRYFRG